MAYRTAATVGHFEVARETSEMDSGMEKLFDYFGMIVSAQVDWFYLYDGNFEMTLVRKLAFLVGGTAVVLCSRTGSLPHVEGPKDWARAQGRIFFCHI